MRTLRRVAVMSVASLALATGWVSTPGAAAGPADPASGSRHIVVLDDSVPDPDAVAREHGRRYGAEIKGIYRNALKGYVATFKGTGAADVARDPRVDFVELDRAVSVQGSQSIGTGGPWGLDRIDDRTGLDGSFGYSADGSGVTAYIIDTGIQTAHPEFGGRATVGTDTIGDSYDGQDCDGHGTHVAGTVGGATYGVAKNVTLVSVRVLDCAGSGSWSGVIAGIDWVTRNRTAKAVANMSLGGPASSAVDTAVTNSIKAGVTYVVAAGNGNQGGVGQDACKSSPARVPGAITIGATDKADTKSGWSNFGKCVDWFAPGVGILSAGLSSGTATMSGTSMASPHSAGVVAQYLSTVTVGSPTLPATVQSTLAGLTTKGAVKSAGKGTTSPNLLFTGF